MNHSNCYNTPHSEKDVEVKHDTKCALKCEPDEKTENKVSNEAFNETSDEASNEVQQHVLEATIFVSIASYRDSQCPWTIQSCLEQAQNAKRIVIGVCQQNEPEDTDCLNLSNPEVLQAARDIRVLRLGAQEAKGPVYARAVIEQCLFQDEDYYLVIDSHTLFTPNWDTRVILELLACPSTKPVLTTYPADFDLQKRQLPHDFQNASFLKFRDFHKRLLFSQQDPVPYKHKPFRPQPSLFWAAGFSFTLGRVVRDCPYDIHLEYVFLGEEITMAARLYTHGYDTFAPAEHIVCHHTLRDYRPTFWELFYKKEGKCKVDDQIRTQRKLLESAGNRRMRVLLQIDQPKDTDIPLTKPYTLGQVRSLQEFEEFVGLDLKNQLHRTHASKGLTKHATDEEMYAKYGIFSDRKR